MDFSGLDVLAVLFAIAIIAGWVDTIAGGGGLVTIPSLIFAGVPASSALATNKFQATFGSLVATYHFVRAGDIDLKYVVIPVIFTFIGAVVGTWLVLDIGNDKLMKVLPFLLISIGLYFLFSKKVDDTKGKIRLGMISFSVLICPILGFYDGFFGPGTGSFMILALVLFSGFGISQATANAKVLNLSSNISSLCYFLMFGEIYWTIGIAMILGQLIGATVAARMVVKNGASIVRPVLVVVCFIMAAKLIFDNNIA